MLDYEVSVVPSPANGTITGDERITLASLRDGLTEASFTGNALDVIAVGGDAASTEKRDGAWIVRFNRPVARGERAVLALRFMGKPARGLVIGTDHIHTDYFACDWMICTQDRPGDKATLSLTITVPEGLRALSSGRFVRGYPGSWTWRLDRPTSSYLYGFAAGRFAFSEQKVGAAVLANYAEEDVASADDLAAALADTPAMIRFFQDRAGLPLPGGGYQQLVVAGSAAQESADYSTLGWDGLSPVLKDPTEDWLAAHELAHQWWGNLVTCASWDDFWLNEGITTFMVAAWKEKRWGRAAYDREMTLLRARVDKARAAGVDAPLTFHGPYPSLGLKRAIVYGKGALFMDALRREMGEARFWAGLKRYTRIYAGGAADSRDFQRAMQAEADKPLGPLFDEWVY
ncbi:aminopeptidase N [Caulobacter ginsengisoli]|uniref:Aminopeptidase N n=1 Tax=Caulobacter ginsengisoli TaxID=400775 RepID=A0ABU0IX33_9CAUL|nr:M1 family aminopeptidase [Caulobacter ginsengisoli]MDQ0465512.1 aminopeptidase N [Caulobacter ginsengisoli]